jgi:hypothetical protein
MIVIEFIKMSVTASKTNGFIGAGENIISGSYSSICEKNPFIQFRSRPMPATFSKKTINLNYTTANLKNPKMLITENSGFGLTSRHQDF